MMSLKNSFPSWLRSRSGALLTVAALQIAVLAWIVGDRVLLVKTGTEIVLPIVPVDPRDLFKGDYVRLSYPISRPTSVKIERPAPDRNAWAFAVLEPDVAEQSNWSINRISSSYPRDVKPGQIVIKAKAPNGWHEQAPFLHFGLERYYVPEGTGLELEKMAREKKLAAVVAVDRFGNTAIKGLSVDGRKIYDEPMF